MTGKRGAERSKASECTGSVCRDKIFRQINSAASEMKISDAAFLASAGSCLLPKTAYLPEIYMGVHSRALKLTVSAGFDKCLEKPG